VREVVWQLARRPADLVPAPAFQLDHDAVGAAQARPVAPPRRGLEEQDVDAGAHRAAGR
jgi:hypothetical protein